MANKNTRVAIAGITVACCSAAVIWMLMRKRVRDRDEEDKYDWGVADNKQSNDKKEGEKKEDEAVIAARKSAKEQKEKDLRQAKLDSDKALAAFQRAADERTRQIAEAATAAKAAEYKQRKEAELRQQEIEMLKQQAADEEKDGVAVVPDKSETSPLEVEDTQVLAEENLENTLAPTVEASVEGTTPTREQEVVAVVEEEAKDEAASTVHLPSVINNTVAPRTPTKRRPIISCTPTSVRSHEEFTQSSVYGIRTTIGTLPVELLDCTAPDTCVDWKRYRFDNGCEVVLLAEDLDCLEGEVTVEHFEDASLLPLNMFFSGGALNVKREENAANVVPGTCFSRYSEVEVVCEGAKHMMLIFTAVAGTIGYRLQLHGTVSAIEVQREALYSVARHASFMSEAIEWTPRSLIKHFVMNSSDRRAFACAVSPQFLASPAVGGALCLVEKHTDRMLFVSCAQDTAESPFVPLPLTNGEDTKSLFVHTFEQDFLDTPPVAHVQEVTFGDYLPLFSSCVLSFPLPSVTSFEVYVTEHRFGDVYVSVLFTSRDGNTAAELTVSVASLSVNAVLDDITGDIQPDTLRSTVRDVAGRVVVTATGDSVSKNVLCVDALCFGSAPDEWVLLEWSVERASSLVVPQDDDDCVFPVESLSGYRELLLKSLKVHV